MLLNDGGRPQSEHQTWSNLIDFKAPSAHSSVSESFQVPAPTRKSGKPLLSASSKHLLLGILHPPSSFCSVCSHHQPLQMLPRLGRTPFLWLWLTAGEWKWEGKQLASLMHWAEGAHGKGPLFLPSIPIRNTASSVLLALAA